jgi:hypothetical protein
MRCRGRVRHARVAIAVCRRRAVLLQSAYFGLSLARWHECKQESCKVGSTTPHRSNYRFDSLGLSVFASRAKHDPWTMSCVRNTPPAICFFPSCERVSLSTHHTSPSPRTRRVILTATHITTHSNPTPPLLLSTAPLICTSHKLPSPSSPKPNQTPTPSSPRRAPNSPTRLAPSSRRAIAASAL